MAELSRPESPSAIVRDLIAETGDAPSFTDRAVPREILEQLVAAATCRYADRFEEPPWRCVIVVGEEREHLVGEIAEALGRHWGLNARPRALASEEVLRAPALILVFSRVPASEGLDAIAQVAFGVQNLLLLAAAEGLATHRTFGTTLVPEAVIDYVARRLGPAYREGELVTMLAIGYPAEPPPPVGKGVRAEWIGCEWCPQPSEVHERV